ncbi:MAG: response regulator [Deltaproteobacteria bacterium]|nr:response regulator [Deltaproteobacteria bacterium]
METMHVLLVDDEEEFLAPLMKRLKKRNIHVYGSESGKAALAALGRHHIDVVVLDVKMPDMDGIEVLQKIKKEYPEVEVILLTGHANLETVCEGIRLGAFDYLMKPMEIDELLYKIEDAYHKKSISEDRVPGECLVEISTE